MNTGLSIVTNVSHEKKILIKGEMEEGEDVRGYMGTLYFLHNFSINLRLLTTKSLIARCWWFMPIILATLII
jgi:hypothetical protein